MANRIARAAIVFIIVLVLSTAFMYWGFGDIYYRSGIAIILGVSVLATYIEDKLNYTQGESK